jgi:hypothetical protein
VRDIGAASILGEHAAQRSIFAPLDADAEDAAANGKLAYGFADSMPAASSQRAAHAHARLSREFGDPARPPRLIPRRKVGPDGASTATTQHAN